MSQNETKQHFELRNIDRDMTAAHEETYKITPREHVRRLKVENVWMLCMLAVVVAIGCYLLGVF